MTALDLITNALQEMGAISQGETPSAADSSFSLSKLNRLLDAWNAQSLFIYNKNFTSFTLIANHQPHLIGAGFNITNTALTSNVATYLCANNFQLGQKVTVGGSTNGGGIFNVVGAIVTQASATQFQVSLIHANVGSAADAGIAVLYPNTPPDFAVSGNRPVRVENANIILNNVNPVVRCPLNIRDDDWWAAQRVQTIATTLPTDLYYSPAFPNGQIFLWPVPTVGWPLELETWNVLGNLPSLTSPLSLAPGYEDAITYTLAETLCPAFNRAPDPVLVAAAKNARAVIQSANSSSPRISTRDSGMPTSGPQRASFNWITGGLDGGR